MQLFQDELLGIGHLYRIFINFLLIFLHLLPLDLPFLPNIHHKLWRIKTLILSPPPHPARVLQIDIGNRLTKLNNPLTFAILIVEYEDIGVFEEQGYGGQGVFLGLCVEVADVEAVVCEGEGGELEARVLEDFVVEEAEAGEEEVEFWRDWELQACY